MKKIIYFGTYEKNYPRNRMIVELLKEEFTLQEIHIPLWEKSGDKTGSFLKLKNIIPFLFSTLFIYFKLFFKLKFSLKRGDLIITGFIGQFDLYFLYFFRFFFKKYHIIGNPLVSFYDTIVEDRKIIKEGSFISKRILNWERKIYSICSQVWVDTKSNRNYFINTFGLDESKVKVVYVGAEDYFYKNKDIKKFENFTVLFYGKYIPLHGLDNIIKTITLMPKSTHWLFIGKGQLYDAIFKDITKLKQIGYSISTISWVNYENLNDFINGAHVTLGIFGNSKKASRVIPNKLFQAVKAESVVVTMDSAAIREIFDEKSIYLSSNNPVDINRKLIEIKDNYDIAKSIAKEGFNKYFEFASKYSIKKDLKSYINLIMDKKKGE